MLISAGANVNHQDENKLTPLHLAAGAESLPSATEECSASDQPVHFAAHETDLVKVDQIPKFAQIVSQTRKSMKNHCIWYILNSSHCKILCHQVLLDHGANLEALDDLHRTPLFVAAANNQVDIVKEFKKALDSEQRRVEFA